MSVPSSHGAADPSDEVGRAVADAHRQEWAYVLAATARVAGDIDLAEECVQEAYGAALRAWPRDGVPRSPAAWLTTTARRKALDVRRRESTLRRKLPLLVEPETTPYAPDRSPGDEEAGVIADDRLRLVFTCCHPALSREAQVALTLRLVCGLNTSEIAQAFLVSEATMAARVTRAKQKISAARIPYRIPAEAELPDRLDAVLTVVHLLFTTGHAAPAGNKLVRTDLVERAIALARMLLPLLPDEREVRGLLALMLLTDARRGTRVDDGGRLVLLEDQDRSQWDRAAIDEGSALVVESLRGARPGRFTLQAVIAAVHADAATYATTDWAQLLAVYDLLLREWPTPVVALNRTVPLAMVAGPAVALAEVERLERDGRLEGYRYLAATKADLLRRLGSAAEARDAYAAALRLADNEAEKTFLARRLAEVTEVSEAASGQQA
ncbi:MAG: polymerase sigma-70 factor, subfamily [Actinomycetota bacterium]|nr:polymerase sigma-70 factor, subfamily [Actinomycetota bacterium]